MGQPTIGPPMIGQKRIGQKTIGQETIGQETIVQPTPDQPTLDQAFIAQSNIAQPNIAQPSTDQPIAGPPAIPDRGSPASVSAQIAAANLLQTLAGEAPRFPAEDGGRSLAEMARSDLDAALQLLADRAQYITGASGAAIALRRGEHADMLCRASAGMNAPELGALLSMEYGLSGESARTGRALRCDNAENDPRVNREGCRHLGIASVAVMPIISERQVLGVFELFSGKPHAFDERDMAALQRLSDMVETAVKQAAAAQAPEAAFAAFVSNEPQEVPAKRALFPQADARVPALIPNPASMPATPPHKEVPHQEQSAAEEVPGRPLFWSAALRAQERAGLTKTVAAEPMTVPTVLRKLEKCSACGFPVSPGRSLCVECEEKRWRGHRLSYSEPKSPEPRSPEPRSREFSNSPESPGERPPEPLVVPAMQDAAEVWESTPPVSAPSSTAVTETRGRAGTVLPGRAPGPGAVARSKSPAMLPATPQFVAQQSRAGSSTKVPAEVPESSPSAPFLSSVVQQQSWLAANKYVLLTLLAVAIVIGAIIWLR